MAGMGKVAPGSSTGRGLKHAMNSNIVAARKVQAKRQQTVRKATVVMPPQGCPTVPDYGDTLGPDY